MVLGISHKHIDSGVTIVKLSTISIRGFFLRSLPSCLLWGGVIFLRIDKF
jgi:hypothetical protein